MSRIDDTKRRLKSGGYLARYLEETGRGAIGGEAEKQIHCPDKGKHAHGDANASARYYSDGDGEHVHCHGCGGHWDLFSLVSMDRGLDFMGALKWCAEHYGMADAIQAKGDRPTGAAQGGAQSVPQYLAECAARYSETDYLRKRGISDAVAVRFGVGWDPNERRVVFPQGSGYSARAVDDGNAMRYKYPKGVPVSAFNLGALWNADGRPVFIVEGQIDALSVIEAGGEAVGLGGTTHQKPVIEAVTARPVSVPVCVSFDNDGRADTAKKAQQLADGLARLGVRLFSASLYPQGCKDANDALLKDRAAFARAISDAVRAAEIERAAALPDRYTLADVAEPPPEDDNPRVILKNGYLRKGQGLMIVSTSGAGKSVMSIQLALFWAMGKEIWGMKPNRPLKIGIVQSEDDVEELAFFRRNMRGGLKAGYGWTDADLDTAFGRVVYEQLIGVTGDKFTDRLREIQKRQGYDVVIVNPLFSFFGGDLSNNADDSHFFRDCIDPIIKNPVYGCAIVFVHHAKKPPGSGERKGWGTDAFAQYIGAGGTDVAGWTRAQLVLMPIDGHIGWYYLIAAKRGGKLGWKDANGKPTHELVISYGGDFVYWRTPDIDEIPEDIKSGAAKMSNGAGIGEADARERIINHIRTRGPIKRTDLFAWCAQQFIGFKSEVVKPCRMAYDDIVNHPGQYCLEVTKARRGAEMFTYVVKLPGMDGGASAGVAGADDGTWDDDDGGDDYAAYDFGNTGI